MSKIEEEEDDFKCKTYSLTITEPTIAEYMKERVALVQKTMKDHFSSDIDL